ncbi:Cyclic nucleotide-binding protein [Pseudocohnilembus persalinus]|uniref:Cyclic nucleotide-binding protein n=1 Tax=Pseudocohnilembus persalinus TaxID=266149 RepID=A0A0V0QSY7_PSEPJ|nr:Cyclic nucleotide-binding protein [Pseudocohnilembus persalinus]|eukprot:KRX05390.1 Cyclic nucleotide-binding protein [Pseudocohnilembus persalinus]
MNIMDILQNLEPSNNQSEKEVEEVQQNLKIQKTMSQFFDQEQHDNFKKQMDKNQEDCEILTISMPKIGFEQGQVKDEENSKKLSDTLLNCSRNKLIPNKQEQKGNSSLVFDFKNSKTRFQSALTVGNQNGMTNNINAKQNIGNETDNEKNSIQEKYTNQIMKNLNNKITMEYQRKNRYPSIFQKPISKYGKSQDQVINSPRTMQLVKEFEIKQKQFKQYLSTQKLKLALNNLLNDTPSLQQLKHFQQIFCQNCLVDKFKKWMRKLLKKIEIWNSQDDKIFIIDVISLVLVVVWMFIVSVGLFFQAKILEANFFLAFFFGVFSIFFFVFQIFVQFNISYFHEGVEIKSRKMIFQKQLRETLVYDLVALFSQNMIIVGYFYNDLMYIFQILYIFKVKSFLMIMSRVENNLYSKGVSLAKISIAKMFFNLLVLTHMIACLWQTFLFIDQQKITNLQNITRFLNQFQFQQRNILQIVEMKLLEEQNTWQQSFNLENEEWYKLYIQSFYWGIALVMLIGTNGNTYIESVFSSCTLLLTVGVFGYLISTISDILHDIQKEDQDFKHNLAAINIYMNSQKLNPNVQNRVRSVLQHLNDSNTNEILKKLPKAIQAEVQQEINLNHLKNFPSFFNLFSSKTMDYLSQYMELSSFVAGEYIFQQGQKDLEQIYLIVKGEVELTYVTGNNKQTFRMCNFKEGQFLGELQFLTGQDYSFNAQCLNLTSVCAIPRDKMLSILQENPEDQQKFQQMQDQMLFEKYTESYEKKCQICGRLNHFEEWCNLTVFRPKKMNVYLKSQYSQDQERNPNGRNSYQGFFKFDI